MLHVNYTLIKNILIDYKKYILSLYNANEATWVYEYVPQTEFIPRFKHTHSEGDQNPRVYL